MNCEFCDITDIHVITNPLVWTDERQPNEECSYNHCIAETPFGRFLLTWKGWKEPYYGGMGFDETPWGDVWYDYWGSIEEAKECAETEMIRRIQSMLKCDIRVETIDETSRDI